MSYALMLNEYIGQLELQGIFITDTNFNINNVNKMAANMFTEDQMKEIINIYKNRSPYFCLVQSKCEVEVIATHESFIFFLIFRNESIITDKIKGSEDVLLDSLKEILNSLSDGVTICNRHGIYIYHNEAESKIHGMEGYGSLGKNAQEIVDSGYINKSACLNVLKEDKPVNIVQTYKNGVQVLVSARPIRDKFGKIQYVVSTTRDMTILKALEKEIIELEKQNKRMNEQLKELEVGVNTQNTIIANDPKMLNVVERAIRIAEVDSTVLIQGESGVGKEGIANLIHQKSKRKDKRLITINCGAIPEQLLESELFGYERGAFTGANSKGKQGLFEIASGGTIFLDEIGEMPLQLQVKLLRVLQESEITRIGGHKPIQIDVRIIAATNRDLGKLVKEEKFREDLFYRLNIIPILIPPLRERKEDILPIIYHFLNDIKHKYGVSSSFTPETLERFRNLLWPGNVRQLKNLIERICLMVNKPEISLRDIEHELTSELSSELSSELTSEFTTEMNQIKGFEINTSSNLNRTFSSPKEVLPLKEQVEQFERNIIIEAVNQFPSVRKAAKALKLDQSTLVRKMQKYQIYKEVSYETN